MMRPLLALAAVAALLAPPPAVCAQGSVVAHGGGARWGDDAHREMVRWMVNQAGPRPDGPVRAVILGAVPREPDEPDAAADAFEREGAAATALVITEENANAPETAAAIEAADIIWIRGGSQSRYVNWWQGTATDRAIRAVFQRGGVVGGTSAGCAVLGEVTYCARNGSLRPEQALADSHHENLTLTHGFLNLVPGVLFDSHFTERGRIGRLPVMMARAKVDFGREVLGVGVDHGTALIIDAKGRAEVIGRGTVAFLHLSKSTEIKLQPGSPPLVTNVTYDRLASGGVYDLSRGRAVSLPDGDALAIPGIHGQHVVADTWARDGALEDRVERAHRALCSGTPATAVLLSPGMAVVDVDGRSRVEHVDGRGSPPMAAVYLRHDIFSSGERIADHNRTLGPGGFSFCGGGVSLIPEGPLVAVGGGIHPEPMPAGTKPHPASLKP